MKIGIVGARLAGSYAALLLKGMGHEILLLDDLCTQEKPCGGGVTGKALRTMAWFRQQQLPFNEIRTLRISAPDGLTGDLPLGHPIRIYSRASLDSSLRDAAIRAGARFLRRRALGFLPQKNGWIIRTAEDAHEVDFLVGADGATSKVRAAVADRYTAADLSLALGFYLPGLYHPTTILTELQEKGFQGYIWSFPRVDHTSVGILRWLPDTNALELRRRVLRFLSAHYPDAGPDRRFYAARIPCLSRRRLIQQRTCGSNWALLGDAAGFADAITSEGIHYALRSAELLADSLRRGNSRLFEHLWRRDFGRDLELAASWRDRFYSGKFLLEAFTRRAIQMIAGSPTVQRLTDTVISGHRSYPALRRQLVWKSPRILVEAFCNRIPRRVLADQVPD